MTRGPVVRWGARVSIRAYAVGDALFLLVAKGGGYGRDWSVYEMRQDDTPLMWCGERTWIDAIAVLRGVAKKRGRRAVARTVTP